MKTKNILLILLAVFILFVAYKYIASGIQENKEKAVIQERATIEQTEKRNLANNLTDCLNLADLDEKYKIDWYLDDFKGKYGTDERIWSPPIKTAFVQLTEETQEETKQKKAECYKRYPQR